MGRKPKQEWKEIDARRSERYAKIGEELEKKVEEILESLQESLLIEKWIHTPKHSAEDHDGIDFIVEKGCIQKSFGVTISSRSWNRAKLIHPKTPQFCFPIGTSDERIKQRILELFDE